MKAAASPLSTFRSFTLGRKSKAKSKPPSSPSAGTSTPDHSATTQDDSPKTNQRVLFELRIGGSGKARECGDENAHATKLQASWRGKVARSGGAVAGAVRSGAKDAAAFAGAGLSGAVDTTLGASAAMLKGAESTLGKVASFTGPAVSILPTFSKSLTDEEKQLKWQSTLRTQMAAYLFPEAEGSGAQASLDGLEASLASGEAWNRPPPVPTAEAVKAVSLSAEAREASSSAKSIGSGFSLSPDYDGMARAAMSIQSKVRGRVARRVQISQAEEVTPVPTAKGAPPALSSYLQAGVSVAVAVGSALLLSAYLPMLYSVVLRVCWVVAAVYAWLRLPYGLGRLASELITRLAVWGYPMTMRTLRLRLWLDFRPLTLHLDLAVTDFRMANPPGAVARDFVAASDVSARSSCDLSFLWTLVRTRALPGPITVRFPHVHITGVDVNFEMCPSGEFNINGVTRLLAIGEVRQALGGIGIHPYRSLTLPNVLRIKLVAARGLVHPSKADAALKPFVKVTVRLHAPCASLHACRRIPPRLPTACSSRRSCTL